MCRLAVLVLAVLVSSACSAQVLPNCWAYGSYVSPPECAGVSCSSTCPAGWWATEQEAASACMPIIHFMERCEPKRALVGSTFQFGRVLDGQLDIRCSKTYACEPVRNENGYWNCGGVQVVALSGTFFTQQVLGDSCNSVSYPR